MTLMTTNEDATSAASRQNSSYANVSTADLVVLTRALGTVPGSLAITAVIARVGSELRRRPRAEVNACVAAANEDLGF